MPEPRRLTCIVCPKGCDLLVDGESVSGNACPRGAEYGLKEVVDPRRVLTTTLRTQGLASRRLPVKTSGPIPLGRLKEGVNALSDITVEGPVACGQVLVKDFLGLGVDLVATDRA